MSLRPRYRYVLPLVLSVVPALASVGCGAGHASSAAAAPAGATRAPVAQGSHGEVRWVADALGDVPLAAAQRSEIEQMAADAEVRQAPKRAARKDLLLAVAAQVEAGAIDRAALQPRLDAVAAATQASKPADRAAFEHLHAILTPDQRVALVDALEARGQRGPEGERGHPLEKLAEELKLTDDQRAKIRDVMMASRHDDHDGGGEHHHHGWFGKHRGAKMLDAFKGDRFVMDEVAPVGVAAREGAKMSDRMIEMTAKVLPILTPEQRAVAARKIRERAGAL